MGCCLLSRNEAVRLERDEVLPSCSNHSHIPFPDAIDLVSADTHRWVTAIADTESKRRITQATIIMYYATRPCVIRQGRNTLGTISVMQAVGK